MYVLLIENVQDVNSTLYVLFRPNELLFEKKNENTFVHFYKKKSKNTVKPVSV